GTQPRSLPALTRGGHSCAVSARLSRKPQIGCENIGGKSEKCRQTFGWRAGRLDYGLLALPTRHACSVPSLQERGGGPYQCGLRERVIPSPSDPGQVILRFFIRFLFTRSMRFIRCRIKMLFPISMKMLSASRKSLSSLIVAQISV